MSDVCYLQAKDLVFSLLTIFMFVSLSAGVHQRFGLGFPPNLDEELVRQSKPR